MKKRHIPPLEPVILIILWLVIVSLYLLMGNLSEEPFFKSPDYIYLLTLMNIAFAAAFFVTGCIIFGRYKQAANKKSNLTRDPWLNLIYNERSIKTKAILQHQEEHREEKDAFTALIHEIKTPVAVIKLLIEDLPPNTGIELGSQIDRMENDLERCLFLLRSSSASRDLFINDLNLQNLIKQRLDLYRHALELKNIRFSCNCDTSILVRSDEKWLAFILDQIIQNSIKYTPDGGLLEFNVKSSGNNHILKIKDNGPGIPQAELPRIFDRGFTGTRGREKGSATGFGLFLAKKLCDRLGHKITAQSSILEKDHGTTLILTFNYWHGLEETGSEISNVTKM